MKKANIPSAAPFFDQKAIQGILEDIESVLKRGILTDGPYVKDFEIGFMEYVGVQNAIAVNSGTSALEIALRYFELKGREVIVPTNTFVATPNSVLFAGGRPVFADILEDTLCIDIEDARKRITARTAGIIVVHIAGLVCPQINDLKELCHDHGLFLLEDAAHAHGAQIDKKMAGSLGDAGCFSFYPTKVMTTGEGGMITTNDDKLTETARRIRTHGLDSKREMVVLGHNWRMSEISAIIGKHQLKNLEEFVQKRNKIAQEYETALRDKPFIHLLKTPANIRRSYYKYPLRLSHKINREKLAKTLREKYGIETGNVYDPPCHLHSFYRKNFGTAEGDLPTSEKVLKKVLCLPMYFGMTREDARYVSKALIDSIASLERED